MPVDRSELLLVSQFFWPEPIGVPLYVTDAAQWLAERGERVNVLTGRPYYPDFRVTEGYELGQQDRQRIGGVDVFRVPTIVPESGRAGKRIVSELNFLVRSVLAFVTGKMERSDKVISFCPSIFATLVGILATRRGGRHVAVVYDIQSGLASGLGMVRSGLIVRLMRLVERLVLNRTSAIIVLSPKMGQALRELGVAAPIQVVPIWVDDTRIFPIPRARRGGPLLLYSGNLGRKQGLEQILDLAAVLKERRPDVGILIRGNGSQAREMMDLASRRCLENVRFEPLVPMDRLNEGLADGDIHLVPQIPEAADFAVPSKVYNIMAAGRPFICTAAEGSSLSMLSEESGACLCVAPNDPDAFADAVIAILNDPDLWAGLGRNGRKYVETHVARDAVLTRYAALLVAED